jgi:hypothetical protein
VKDLFKESSLLDQCSPPGTSESSATNPKLEVVVVFTSVDATVAAMHRAAALLKGLDGHISLLDFQVVPQQLSFENPPVSVSFTKRRLVATCRSEFHRDDGMHLPLPRPI